MVHCLPVHVLEYLFGVWLCFSSLAVLNCHSLTFAFFLPTLFRPFQLWHNMGSFPHPILASRRRIRLRKIPCWEWRVTGDCRIIGSHNRDLYSVCLFKIRLPIYSQYLQILLPTSRRQRIIPHTTGPNTPKPPFLTNLHRGPLSAPIGPRSRPKRHKRCRMLTRKPQPASLAHAHTRS